MLKEFWLGEHREVHMGFPGLCFVSVNATFAVPFQESRHSSAVLVFLREEKQRGAKAIFW